MKANKVDRQSIKIQLFESLENGELQLSKALKMVRKVVNKNQEDYAKLVGVSKKVVADFELNKGNPTLSTINKLFAPIGLEVGLTRRKK